MAIKILTEPTTEDLRGKSHWWGTPDLPKGVAWPCRAGSDDEDKGEALLTFICQIRLEDIAHLDTEGLLPHSGMLWFFADIDYFCGDEDAMVECIGDWDKESFKVIYSPNCNELCTHEAYWEDGSPAVLAAEKMTFEPTDDYSFGHKLLGRPAMTEGYEDEADDISLLQVDEEERWNLRFYDCGLINFTMKPHALARHDFDDVKFTLHSY